MILNIIFRIPPLLVLLCTLCCFGFTRAPHDSARLELPETDDSLSIPIPEVDHWQPSEKNWCILRPGGYYEALLLIVPPTVGLTLEFHIYRDILALRATTGISILTEATSGPILAPDFSYRAMLHPIPFSFMQGLYLSAGKRHCLNTLHLWTGGFGWHFDAYKHWILNTMVTTDIEVGVGWGDDELENAQLRVLMWVGIFTTMDW